ncbi:hypothetical protein AVEN_120244-1 [Araneus ventricosus]|uniref:Uncharacterized protein n=1 Tax=Araneus ventricosus TaxID=182803 RepID=A0A4Y2XBR1_ARAVE|nr:hypothetical protein AVEN_120244-1 [Araneus ventricosus]
MKSFLSLRKFQADDTQVLAINCTQRKEQLFSRKIHSGARNRLSPVSVEWGGLGLTELTSLHHWLKAKRFILRKNSGTLNGEHYDSVAGFCTGVRGVRLVPRESRGPQSPIDVHSSAKLTGN